MYVVLILTFILFVLGIVENATLKKRISKVKVRILVNGTRGKSSTVRLLTTALNNMGVRTIGKSTGTDARFILPDLSEMPVDRKRGVNMVREQKKLFSLAEDYVCSAIVCECQAVRPESQLLYAKKIFCPTFVAITNFRQDHEDEMGPFVEDTIRLSIPTGVQTVIAPNDYCISNDGFSFDVHPQNIALALEVLRTLGFDEESSLNAMKSAQGDIGHFTKINAFSRLFINGFAVNDSESAAQLFSGLDCSNTTVVFANRSDREYRIKQFSGLFDKLGLDDRICIGDNLFKAGKIMRARTYKSSSFEDLVSSCRQKVVLCGNIVGSGKKFVDFLRGNSK